LQRKAESHQSRIFLLTVLVGMKEIFSICQLKQVVRLTHAGRSKSSAREIPQTNDHVNLLHLPLWWYLGQCLDKAPAAPAIQTCRLGAGTPTHTGGYMDAHGACLEVGATICNFPWQCGIKCFRASFEASFSPCPSHYSKIVTIHFSFEKWQRENGAGDISGFILFLTFLSTDGAHLNY